MSESTNTEETCMHCGGEVGVVIEGTSGRWGPNGPPVSFEDRYSRCQSCGEEWYDMGQSQRHTSALLKATVAALTAENERLTREKAELQAFADYVIGWAEQRLAAALPSSRETTDGKIESSATG